MFADSHAPGIGFGKLKFVTVYIGNRAQNAHSFGGYFRTDAIASKYSNF
jgi:hypothetical protein